MAQERSVSDGAKDDQIGGKISLHQIRCDYVVKGINGSGNDGTLDLIEEIFEDDEFAMECHLVLGMREYTIPRRPLREAALSGFGCAMVDGGAYTD
jgi:hypothetical protein